MLRHDLVDCAFIGIAAGATGAVIGYLLKFGFDEAHLFSFFGALSGAMASVSGAIYFSNREKITAHEAEVEIICQSLLPLINKLDEIAILWPKQAGVSGFTPDFRRTIAASGSESFKALSVLDEAIKYSDTLNFQQRASLRQCQDVIKGFVAYYERAITPEYFNEYNDDHLNWHMKVHQVRGSVRTLFISLGRSMADSQADVDRQPSHAL
jgi:hypothetical protein